MKLFTKSTFQFLTVFLVLPLALVSSCSNNKAEKNLSGQRKSQINPASPDEIKLYRQIGTNYICIARQADVEFSKAIAIAATNFAAIVDRKHGGLIVEVGENKLTPDQIYRGSYFQLIEGAIRSCPDEVPAEEKDKFQKLVNQIKDQNEE